MQSPNGYPALLDAENQIHLRANAACTGATTSDVSDEQLSALKQGTRLVTLTVGAADLGLSQVLAACTAGTPTQCQEAIRLANLLLPAECGDESELGRRLTDLRADVAAAAPNALILDVTKAFAGHGIGCRCTVPFINPPDTGIKTPSTRPRPVTLPMPRPFRPAYRAPGGAIRSRSPNFSSLDAWSRPRLAPALTVGAYEPSA